MTRTDDSHRDAAQSGWKLWFSDEFEPGLARAQVRRSLFPGQGDIATPDTVLLGRYEIIRRLGRGGMGTVYLAHDPALARDVAVKILHDSDSGLALDANSNSVRIRREAIALGQLTHANVVRVYDVGEDGARTYIAMEYVPGGTLRAWQKSNRSSPMTILRAYAEAGRGLAAAHEAGLLHRDFKPDNVLVGADERMLVSDFGLVRLTLSVTSTPSSFRESGELRNDITRSGAVVGTPAYMAPELFEGDAGDALSDQFAFCIALFEALVGRRPFGDVSDVRNNAWASLATVEHSALRQLPRGVRRLLLRGLQPSRSSRYPEMVALLEVLDHEVGTVKRRRTQLEGAVLSIVLVGGGVGLVRAGEPVEHPLCRLTDPQTSVYSEQRRASIAASFEDAQLPDASSLYARVGTRLDARVHSWAAAVGRVCRDSDTARSDALRARQLECLQERQRDLEALGVMLETVDRNTARVGVELVIDPESRPSCEDERSLRGQVAPPSTAELTLQVATLRGDLARGSVLVSVGELERARGIARSVRSSTEAQSYPPLRIEADYLRAKVLKSSKHRGDALTAFRALELKAEAAGHDRVALAASVLHLELLVDEHRPPLEVQTRIEHARARALRLGDDSALVNIGFSQVTLQQHLGNLERALEVSRSVLELAKKRLGAQHPNVAYAHDYVGGALAELGRFDGALEHKRSAIAVLEHVYGPDAVGLSVLLNTAGSVARLAGKHTLARRWHARALANLEACLGPDSPRLTEALAAAAVGAQARGAADEALVLLRRQLALETQQDIVSNTTRRAIVEALVLAGRLAQAAVAYDEAMQALAAAGPNVATWDWIDTFRIGAQLALLQGDLKTAVHRAHLSVKSVQSDARGAVYSLVVLAQVDLAHGHFEQAADWLKQAERRVGDRLGTVPVALAALHATRLELVRAAGTPADIDSIRTLALVSARRAFGPRHPARMKLERNQP